jgi:hypothetical protein
MRVQGLALKWCCFLSFVSLFPHSALSIEPVASGSWATMNTQGNAFLESLLVSIAITDSSNGDVTGCSGTSVGGGLVLTAAHCLLDSTGAKKDPAIAEHTWAIKGSSEVNLYAGSHNLFTLARVPGGGGIIASPTRNAIDHGKAYAVEFHPSLDIALVRTTTANPAGSRFSSALVEMYDDLIATPSDVPVRIQTNMFLAPVDAPPGVLTPDTIDFYAGYKAGYSYTNSALRITRGALVSAALIGPVPVARRTEVFPINTLYFEENASKINNLYSIIYSYGNGFVSNDMRELQKVLEYNYGMTVEGDSGGPLFINFEDVNGISRIKLAGMVQGGKDEAGLVPVRGDRLYTWLPTTNDWLGFASQRLRELPSPGESSRFAAYGETSIQGDSLLHRFDFDFADVSASYVDELDSYVTYVRGTSGLQDTISAQGGVRIKGVAFFDAVGNPLDLLENESFPFLIVQGESEFRWLGIPSLPDFELLASSTAFGLDGDVKFLKFEDDVDEIKLDWLDSRRGLSSFNLALIFDFEEPAQIFSTPLARALSTSDADAAGILWSSALPVPEPRISVMFLTGLIAVLAIAKGRRYWVKRLA